ncbi:hypothetical protein RhiirB3_450369 [Rhizophagus irregularis]|nr:hypothetical protein RhiirB3_450369 [Rhizophagus irregularis]
MKYKRLTDKQVLYIYNSLIIPRIEYRSQITIFNKSESTSVIAPFRKIFKHKLHLALFIPNAILNNNFIYTFRDLYELQLQSKISNYNLQINSRGLLGIITDIRIPHNFKGIFITHPSFDNNIKGWTTFWVDRFNSPYFRKIIKKDTIKKKIYVQHFLLSRQNNLTFFDPCHGCVLNNHQNGDCIFIIPHTDLVLIPKNTITQATVRPRMSFDLRDLFQQARFLFQFNRRLISFYQDSIFVKQHNNIITRYIDFSESRNDLLRIQQQLSDTSTLTFYTDGSLIDNGSESCSMSFGFAQACDLSPKFYHHALNRQHEKYSLYLKLEQY